VTERKWLTAKTYEPIYGAVASMRNARKLRLFACACCRRVWPYLPDGRSRAAVEAAEGFADGAVTRAQLAAAARGARRATAGTLDERVAGWSPDAEEYAARAVEYAAGLDKKNFRLGFAAWQAAMGVGQTRARTATQEKCVQAALLRCIFGNPFRPVTLNPSWLTSTVVSLAAGVYADRAFDRLPILADALQDAGCDSADVLDHCRGPGAHVRGCWVVDLVLGKG
jgi:hypothetical protein